MKHKHLLTIFALSSIALGSGFFGGGGGSSVTLPGSSTDNAVVRWDSTAGTSIQNSSLTVSDIATNKVTVSTPSVAGTATQVQLESGASSQASTAGGDLILRPGNGGSGAERGNIVIPGTANSAGNRTSVVTETDGINDFGYDYISGGYKRFRNLYLKSSIGIRNTGGGGAGVVAGHDATTPYINLFRSTSNSGIQLQNLYHSVFGIYNEAGNLAFNFGRWDGSGSNYGEFWLMKSSGAHIKWETDGAGDIGSATDDRPANIYATTGIYKSTYRIDPHEYDAGNSGASKTLNWTNGSVQKLTLTDNTTLTLSNPVTGGVYAIRVLTGAGSFTVTWPSEVKWPGGTGPTITTTASRMDLVNLLWDGTNYYGSFTQNYTP